MSTVPGISTCYVRIGCNELAGPAGVCEYSSYYSAALVVFAAAQNTNLPCIAIDAGWSRQRGTRQGGCRIFPLGSPPRFHIYPQFGAFLCRFGYEMFHGFTYIGIGTDACFVWVRCAVLPINVVGSPIGRFAWLVVGMARKNVAHG